MKNNIDPFSMFSRTRNNFLGLDIIESKSIPRYQLPEELIPGVPWDKKFRDDFNKWALEFLGTTNIIPANTVYIIADRYIVARPETAVKIIDLGT